MESDEMRTCQNNGILFMMAESQTNFHVFLDILFMTIFWCTLQHRSVIPSYIVGRPASLGGFGL